MEWLFYYIIFGRILLFVGCIVHYVLSYIDIEYLFEEWIRTNFISNQDITIIQIKKE